MTITLCFIRGFPFPVVACVGTRGIGTRKLGKSLVDMTWVPDKYTGSIDTKNRGMADRFSFFLARDYGFQGVASTVPEQSPTREKPPRLQMSLSPPT
jgi:hypothetical protein